ncbi:MAG TPA: hypothetical protein VGI79_13565 [Caulobacteraceae bacterium]|jgi:hypothetical protein
MKHAGADALDQLEPLLLRLRAFDALKERARGTYYVKSRAFLHFHEDPKGLFADLRGENGVDFDRFQIDAPSDQDALVRTVSVRLGGSAS